MEKKFPGMWQRWFKNSCVAVGWQAKRGYFLDSKKDTKKDDGWKSTRTRLLKIKEGDWVVVSLGGNRIARIGEVIKKTIEDKEWKPLISASEINDKGWPDGEMGRRIYVRWDWTLGPDNQDCSEGASEISQPHCGWKPRPQNLAS